MWSFNSSSRGIQSKAIVFTSFVILAVFFEFSFLVQNFFHHENTPVKQEKKFNWAGGSLGTRNFNYPIFDFFSFCAFVIKLIGHFPPRLLLIRKIKVI